MIFLLQLSHPCLAQIRHVASIDQFPEHARVDRFRDAAGSWQPISKPEDWEVRLTDIRKQVASVMGSLPSIEKRSPPEVEWIDQSIDGSVVRKKLRYRSEEGDWVTALLLMPKGQTVPGPAMLALHQTIPIGKEEPAGMGGNPHLHYAKELAGLGYVVLAPDYPSFGEHPYAFDQNPQWASGTLKAVWDAMRGVDLLSSLSEVDAGRIGAIGHSLGAKEVLYLM
ncbi:MAG: dienelactone hydrolase family protein, partial [Pirellulaceae bacterium]